MMKSVANFLIFLSFKGYLTPYVRKRANTLIDLPAFYAMGGVGPTEVAMELNAMTAPFLVTGAAGFIGYHLADRLLAMGYSVIGFDNFNDYYDPRLKEARWSRLEANQAFTAIRGDLADKSAVSSIFKQYKPQIVMHLAAQAGVRYSLEAPQTYIDSNITGFLNILEGARDYPVDHLIYASSSSVYGGNKKMPFSVEDSVDHPISLYAATKKANEVMAHTYASLFQIPVTGLRFFTVYGPWGRPDMALFKFLKKMKAGEVIDIYNHGNMERDFTYIDDIIESMIRLIDKAPVSNPDFDMMHATPAGSYAPYAVHNIGRAQPEKLMDVVAALEKASGITAQKNFMDIQPGDVKATYADVAALEAVTGYIPQVSIKDGIQHFVDWYTDYYG